MKQTSLLHQLVIPAATACLLAGSLPACGGSDSSDHIVGTWSSSSAGESVKFADDGSLYSMDEDGQWILDGTYEAGETELVLDLVDDDQVHAVTVTMNYYADEEVFLPFALLLTDGSEDLVGTWGGVEARQHAGVPTGPYEETIDLEIRADGTYSAVSRRIDGDITEESSTDAGTWVRSDDDHVQFTSDDEGRQFEFYLVPGIAMARTPFVRGDS